MRFTLLRTRAAGALAVFALLAPGTTAHADIVFNNFGPLNAFGDSGRLVQGESVGTIGNVDQAVQFSVGANPYDLTLVSLGVHANDPPNTGTGPIDVQIATNSAGLPGAVLGTVQVNVAATGKQVITANFNSSVQLDPNTSYWVIANGRTTFDGAWNFNSIGDMGPTAGRTEGFPWNLRPDDTRMALRVEGNIVPEPAAVSLICVGGITALLRRRSRTR